MTHHHPQIRGYIKYPVTMLRPLLRPTHRPILLFRPLRPYFHLRRPLQVPMSQLTTAAFGGNVAGGNGTENLKAKLRGVVFDMDGTLTVPTIDFQAMYRTVLGEEQYLTVRKKNPSGIDILHIIEDWSPYKQQKAYECIAEFEKLGLDSLQIMPGASELCGFLDSKQLRRGLITRNVKAAVDLFHSRFGLIFSPALSREFRPYKPDPGPLLHICSTWGISPSEVMMVGDSLKDDVACGRRAGAFTCLLDETGRYKSPEFDSVEHRPHYTVSSLDQVVSILETNFELTGPMTLNQ